MFQELGFKKMKKKRTIEIKLANHPEPAIIDEEDYLLVANYHWRYIGRTKNEYPYVVAVKRVHKVLKTFRMHRIIMNANPEDDVHHLDRNTLNNRKKNLECRPREEHRGRHGKDYI